METTENPSRVIIADDDPIIRSVLRAQLEALNQTVFLAPDGLEAVELASRMQAALILLDLRMPLLDGLFACRSIRQVTLNAQTPIVILTSCNESYTESAATNFGATMFLTKPFRPAALMEALARFLPISETARQIVHEQARQPHERSMAALKDCALTSGRIAEAKQTSRRYLGGSPPFGWRIGGSGELISVPEQQQTLKEMRALRADGASLNAISTKITAAGNRITLRGIKKILTAVDHHIAST